MKIIKQICIILGICWISMIIEYILPFAFSSAIIGMLVMMAALLLRILRVEQVEEVADFLLQNMAFLFVPAGVSIMNYGAILRENAWQIFLICFVTTIVVFGVTSIAMRITMKLMRRRGKEC